MHQTLIIARCRDSVPLGLIGLLLSACGGPAAVAGDDTLPATELPTLVGRFAPETVHAPLVAKEALIGDRDFYISYEGVSGLVYSGGNWSDRIDIVAVEERGKDDFAGPYILPLQYRLSSRWPNLPETPIRPRLLSAVQWERFRTNVLKSLTPTDAGAGIVMHFNADDYFLFYNEQGKFESRLIVDKPAEYHVADSIDFSEFLRQGLPQLGSFLTAEGITERRIVFSTGDTGAYALPFLYVNLDLALAVFVRHASTPRIADISRTETQIAQSVGHVSQSHLTGLAIRPVSSLYRLLFATTDAVVETVNPTSLAALESQPIPDVHQGPPMRLDDWERQLDQITGRESSTGTIDYLIDGQEYFTRLIDEITSASRSVHIRTYIFDNDDYAETFGNLLKRRSNEGIDIKVLLDGLGTILATGTQDQSTPEDYIAPASVRQFLESNSEINVRQSTNPWMTGDHVKTTIIDDRIAFTGGMNIGREYRYVWHDLMMEARGPIVDILRKAFDDAWAHAGPFGDIGLFFEKLRPDRTIAENTGYPVRVLFTRTGDSEIFNSQLAAIRNARRYVYVQNAYLTDDAMLYELAKARRRGVDVRVIMPLVGNHGPVNQSNALAANAMLKHGIRVFLYPGMSHVKAAVFDGWACLGSANWDKLSLRINQELNLATSHEPAVDRLVERLFEADFARSVELDEPFPERWSDHLFEVIADYLL